MFTVNDNGSITQDVEHWMCNAEIRCIDRRTDEIETFSLFFELRPDYDETDGYIKAACERILHSLGFSFLALLNFRLTKYEYDAGVVFCNCYAKDYAKDKE